MKKKFLLIVLVIVLFLGTGAVLYRSGVMVAPTTARLKNYSEVERFDILDFQHQREQEILDDYSAGTFTLQNPYIIQDPYQANPLSAMLLFETEQPAATLVTVVGKDEFTTFSYTYQELKKHHEIAVLGLYPNTPNKVTVTVMVEGSPDQTVELNLQTEDLPYDFPSVNVEVSKPHLMEPGVTLMTACFQVNYTYLLDANGEVRAYFSNKNFGHGTAMRVLDNGRLLATGDIMKMMPYNMYTLWEMNLLGKVFVEYEVPNAVHHDIIELEDGDFLAASNNKDMPLNYDTREDVIIRINRETGLVTEEYDLRTILDDRREPYHHFTPDIINMPNRDWAHLNSTQLDTSDNSLIASSPTQSSVVKFDRQTNQIRWILSSHEGWDGDYSKYQQYLLTPVGSEAFEWSWGQHAITILSDQDNNPDTLDLLLFDNGQSRSYLEDTSVPPQENYSRAVIYRIDETNMTVEQLWHYGKERGSEAYATFLGNADYLEKTGNILVNFGGMLRKDGVPVDSVVDGVLGLQEVQSRVVEVLQSGEEVFDVYLTPKNSMSAETYQAHRIAIYTEGIDYSLAEMVGQRIGEVQSAQQVDLKLPGIFINRLDFNFNQIFERDGYLYLQGNFYYQDKTYLIGRVNFVLKSNHNEYIFQGPAGMNGNFYTRIDLNNLEPGEYAIYAAGAVIEGNDAQGKMKAAYNPTGYKITVR